MACRRLSGVSSGRSSSLLALIFLSLSTSLGALPVVALTASELSGDPEPRAVPAAAPVRYSRDVRPLLSDRCFQCHGADPSSREAGLRLDLEGGATADLGGYAAVVPGDPEASELWRRISNADPDDRMPPAHAKKRPLTDTDKQLLRAWIDQGAAYEEHWAFVAPVTHDAPEFAAAPASSDEKRVEGWSRAAIDRWVLAGLEAAGVQPSVPADAATLARRVYLDLTGLPPSVEALDDFLASCAEGPGGERGGAEGTEGVSEQAYVALVDRLLHEEPWRSRVAEHLTVPWLDAARFADTIGIHTDNGRQMWLWRDWVLNAFRDNMPYDQFVTEQLAGDLLPDATDQQRVASGFNRNHVLTDEGGAIPDEYLVEYAVDRVNTVSSVFLGLTSGCARCHDHKFDPITQEDYYSLLAYFNSNDEPGLFSQTPDAQRAYEPFLSVPTDEQREHLDELSEAIERLSQQLEEPIPGEAVEQASFLREVALDAGLSWTIPKVLKAESSDDSVTLRLQEDGALLAEGPIPLQEDYEVLLATKQAGLRALLLEALSVPGQAGAGRASHGNAVLTRLSLETRSTAGDAWQEVPLIWAWSDHTQTNYDHEATHVLDGRDDLGWAVDGNQNAGPRTLLLLSEEPFGEQGGCELRVRLAFRSPYTAHSLGRIRLRVSPVSDTGSFGPASGRWWRAGPFEVDAGDVREVAYEAAYGPEQSTSLDIDARFGDAQRAWTFDGALADGSVSMLGDAVGATFVGRELWAPDARTLEVALGSDDGLQVFHDGEQVFENRVDRGAALDQDRLTLSLHPGRNMLVLKVVNTGGPGAFAWQSLWQENELVGELGSALLPETAVTAEQVGQFRAAWRRQRFDSYRELDDARSAAQADHDGLQDEVPRTMVMSELGEARETYVLMRGQYDQPDMSRPVSRGTPSFLPPLPDGAPADRRGLAEWLVSPEHPLFARVAVNRFWALMFGEGLVRTGDDFGMQGAWPSHPELLDQLSVEFRDSGWDVRALLRRIVLSATYRQASMVREDLAARDPANRLLARYPRRRLSAEQIRDVALWTSGLLVERLGGPSVKPYQPEGLWKEVAMLASNTREFARDEGEALWRRSLYTYWKRAVPPPSLLTLDAPTRESCVVQRRATNTPLQALVLWNDEQFVEAARKLAERVLDSDASADADRVVWLMRTCTGRRPDAGEQALLLEGLGSYRQRFGLDVAAAESLLNVGEAPRSSEHVASELAAWTLLSNAVLNLHETLTQD